MNTHPSNSNLQRDLMRLEGAFRADGPIYRGKGTTVVINGERVAIVAQRPEMVLAIVEHLTDRDAQAPLVTDVCIAATEHVHPLKT